MAAEWVQKASNEVHQGFWMTRAKQRHPDDVTLSSEEIHARCDCVLGIIEGFRMVVIGLP